MHTTTDAEPLLDYRATRGEEAFGEIVRRCRTGRTEK